jgi:hypothetical protein
VGNGTGRTRNWGQEKEINRTDEQGLKVELVDFLRELWRDGRSERGKLSSHELPSGMGRMDTDSEAKFNFDMFSNF